MRTLSMQELRKTESSLRTERDQWRDQATANKHEVEKLRGIFNWMDCCFWRFRNFFFWVPFTLCRRNLKNRSFILKTHQFRNTKLNLNLKFKTQQSPVILDLCLRKTLSGITWFSLLHRLQKALFSKCFSFTL